MRRPISPLAWLAPLALVTALPSQQLVAGPTLTSWDLSAAGNLDDDGFDDLLNSATSEFVSGRTMQPIAHLSGLVTPGSLRCDLDADGHDDVYHRPTPNQVAFVSGATGALLFTFGPNPNYNYGAARSTGDVDRDGHDDVLVFGGDPQFFGGYGYLVSGRSGQQLQQWALANDGYSTDYLDPAGDLNGDGHPDLLLSNISQSVGSSAALLSPNWVQMQIPGLPLGAIATPVFDMDGDGVDDVHDGFNYLSMPSGQVLWSPFGQMRQQPFDADGDGARDFLAWNQVIWSGRTHTQFGTVGTTLGVRVLGDVDGDGRDELLAGGRIWEVEGGAASGRVRTRGGCGATSSASSARMTSRLRPRLGDTMRIDLRGAGADHFAFRALGFATDVDLAPLGAAGNRMFVDPVNLNGFLADGDGYRRTLLPIPTTAALLGLAASLQWAVLDPAANALGIVTSNAVDLIVGS